MSIQLRSRSVAPLARALSFAAGGLALVCAVSAPAQTVTSTSGDVTITLGAGNLVVADHAVAVDNGLGVVALESLGAIPEASDVIAYAEAANGTRYLSFDTTVSLAGGIVVRPGDVVARTGSSYAIAFSAAAAGLAPGVRTDAVAVASTGGLLLSFDVDTTLPGGLHVADEDLVRWSGGVFSLAFDGSQAGIDRALDVDAVDDLGGSTYLVSFDASGTVGGVAFADEDVLRRSGSTWSLERDGSALDPDWIAADLDAMQLVPEPGFAALLASGGALLAAIGARGWRRRTPRTARIAGRARLRCRAGVLGLAAIAGLVPVAAPASDGVLEINQVCAATGGCFPGDVSGFPVTITARGSYRLSSNLSMPSAFSDAIVVSADDVTIDFNGFAILGQVECGGTPVSCTPSTASGVGVSNANTLRFVRVRNGTIRGMGSHGLNLGRNAEVSDMRIVGNRGNGIMAWTDSMISGNVVYENLFTGVVVRGGSVVEGNVVARNGTTGIADGGSPASNYGVLASGNSIHGNGSAGVNLIDGAAAILGNTVYDNGGDGILAGDGANVNGNTVTSNGGFGLSNFGSESVTYTDNVLTTNATNVESHPSIFDRGGNACGTAASCP